MPSVFHTGKDDIRRIGNLYDWHGEQVAHRLGNAVAQPYRYDQDHVP